MFRKGFALIGFFLGLGVILSGCGGGKGSGGSGSSGGSGGSGDSGITSVSITSSAPSVDGSDAASLSATVQDDNHAEGVTWSLSGAGTLSNTSTTAATYTAPAATTSAQTVTVMAVSIKETTKYATTTITVAALPAITTGSNSLGGTVGSAYSVQLAGSGGITPYTWSVSSGALPAGLSLSPTGAISGTPTAGAAGSTSVVFQLKDSGTPAALATTQKLTFAIAAAPEITFTGLMPGTGSVSQAYAGSAAASGGIGTLAYSLSSGALPTGLSLNTATGAVAGTISVGGTYNFSIKAADTFGDSATQTYQIAVNVPLVNVTPGPGSLPYAVTGQAYSQALTASGGSGSGYTWAVSGLSNGLTSSANGATLTINGPATAAGTVSFTATATDGAGNPSSALSYSIQVYGPVTLPASNPTSLPSSATWNVAYTGTVVASGGSGNFAWTVTGQSDGLNTTSSGGTLTLSGTPAATGTVALSVSVKDTTTGVVAGPYSYVITVYANVILPAPNPATLGPATLNLAYTGTIVAAGGSGNYSWTVTGLPANGLNYSATGGTLTISGTPAATTTVSFGVSVKDTSTNLTVGPFTYSVTVNNALTLPAPNPATLGSADAGLSYNGTIVAAGGSGNYSWIVTGLSNGLSFSPGSSTLTINGTPAAPVTVSFSVAVKDNASNNTVGPYTYTITVYSALALPAPDPLTLPSIGYTTFAYTGTINATGGSGAYSWQVTGITDNLVPSPSGGVLTISGTPGATPATVTFNVKLTDTATGESVTQNGYNVTVIAPAPLALPAPNPASLPYAVVNQLYAGSISATGGVPPYTWSVNGVAIPNTGSAVSIADAISVSNDGSNVLAVGGTPTVAQTVNLTNVKVTDSLGANQTNSYTIAVYPTFKLSGQISLNPTCGSSGASVPAITVSLLTSPGGAVYQTVTTDSNGNFLFPAVINGNYTITPSIMGPSSVFYPASESVNINGADVAGESFNVALGYTVCRHGKLRRIQHRTNLPFAEYAGELLQPAAWDQRLHSRSIHHPRRAARHLHIAGMDGSLRTGQRRAEYF